MQALSAFGISPFSVIGRESAIVAASSFALNFATSSDHVTIPEIVFAGNFNIELKSTQLTNATFLISGGDAGNNGIDIYRGNTSRYTVYINQIAKLTSTALASDSLDNPDTLILSRTGTTVTFSVNGVSQGTFTESGSVKITMFGFRTGWTTYGNTRLYSAKLQDLATPANSRIYNPSLSKGAGSILPTEDGLNQGTLVNFPTDNTQWFYYVVSSGGINAEVSLEKSTISLIGKIVESISDANVDFTKSTVQLIAKTVNVESSASVDLAKSTVNINSKAVVGVADGSVSFSKSVVNIVAKQLEASTSSAINAEVDLLKSSVSIVGKSLTVSSDANIDLSKSLVNLVGKQLGLTNDAIVSLSKSNVQLVGKLLIDGASSAINAEVDLIKGVVTLSAKELQASTGAQVDLNKSVVTLIDKLIISASDANAELLKGVVQLTGKFLSVGDIAYSIPADRIFLIPTTELVFNIYVNNKVLNIPETNTVFVITEDK